MESITDFLCSFAESVARFVKRLTQAWHCAMAKLRIILRKFGLLPYIRPRTRSLKRARIYQRRAIA